MQASGAGDGLIRLWQVKQGSPVNKLEAKGALHARGFVNGLAIARSGTFLVAAIGQEPRLGRWVRDSIARNGTVIAPIALVHRVGC
jgi:ribosomal RNA-processing protein 9